MGDKFKQVYNDKATAYDFYCCYCKGNSHGLRGKDKKMLHRIARSRMKKDLQKEIEND